MSKKYQGIVIKGLGNGKTKAFATVNLEPNILAKDLDKGVYASWVFVNDKKYRGALYFGPRKIISETKDVLEIHILDFQDDIYGQEISFSLEKFIIGVKDFSTFEELKKQIASDIQEVTAALHF